MFDFNKKTKSSIKFGFNTTSKLIQSEANKDLTVIFIFYDDDLKLLIDLLVLKCKSKENLKLYIIDKSFR